MRSPVDLSEARPRSATGGSRLRIVMIAAGVFEYTIELVNALSQRHDVDFLVPGNRFGHLVWAVHPRVRLHMLDWPRHRDPRSLFFAMRLARIIERWRPDIIHFQCGQVWLNLLMPLLDQHTFVMTVHDVLPHVGDQESRKIPEWIGAFTIRHAHRLITHGERLRVALADRHHIPLDRIDVIPHGVLSFYRRLLPSPNGNTSQATGRAEVLFFGRIYTYKGLEYLIRAQPKITRAVPEARIVIAGRGEAFDKYAAMLPDPEKFVIYNEYIPNRQVAELFDRAAVVVLPYIGGSQSGVLQIAYAFGKPVVATRVGSIEEAVDDGLTGRLVPPGDADALADAIIALLRDPARRATMRQHIAQQVATRFAWSHIAEATERTYRRAIAYRSGLL